MRKFQLLLFNTIQKEARSKTLLFISIITVVMILLMNSLLSFVSKEILSQYSEGAAQGTATALVFIINKFTALIAIIFGVNCIKSDMESNVAPLLMSFPISRLEYLISRILGTWIIVMIYYLLSVFVAQLLLSSSVGSIIGGPHLLGAMFFTSLSNLVIIVVSSFFGLNMPKIMGFMATSFFSIIVTVSNGFMKSKEFSEVTEDLTLFKGAGLFIHSAFPRIGNLDDMARGILMKSEMSFNIPLELAHFTFTLGLFFFLFYFLFSRREV